MAVPTRAARSPWTWTALVVGVLLLAAVAVRSAQDDAGPRIASGPAALSTASARPVQDPGPAPDAQQLAAQVRLVLSAEIGDLDCGDPVAAQDWSCLVDRVEPDSTQSVRLVLAVPAEPWSTHMDARELSREAGRGALRLLAPELPHLDRVVVGEEGMDWATVSRRTVAGS